MAACSRRFWGEDFSSSQESQLRGLVARDPADPAPHFALGNALASQGRWAEAQQSFFAAAPKIERLMRDPYAVYAGRILLHYIFHHHRAGCIGNQHGSFYGQRFRMFQENEIIGRIGVNFEYLIRINRQRRQIIGTGISIAAEVGRRGQVF